MPEPSLALLQTLMKQMLEQQRQTLEVLERIERNTLILLERVGYSERIDRY